MADLEEKIEHLERGIRYPQLLDEIDSRGFRIRTNLVRALGLGEVIKPLIDEIREAATNGTITADLFLEEGKPSSKYQIVVDEVSATELVAVAKKILANPFGLSSIAELMSPELEDLLCGTAGSNKYKKIE